MAKIFFSYNISRFSSWNCWIISRNKEEEFFEEAAGISKYKARKREALRKLDNVTEGLEKIKTITLELEKQLKPLKKQSEKAKLYLEKKRRIKISWNWIAYASN